MLFSLDPVSLNRRLCLRGLWSGSELVLRRCSAPAPSTNPCFPISCTSAGERSKTSQQGSAGGFVLLELSNHRPQSRLRAREGKPPHLCSSALRACVVSMGPQACALVQRMGWSRWRELCFKATRLIALVPLSQKQGRKGQEELFRAIERVLIKSEVIELVTGGNEGRIDRGEP